MCANLLPCTIFLQQIIAVANTPHIVNVHIVYTTIVTECVSTTGRNVLNAGITMCMGKR